MTTNSAQEIFERGQREALELMARGAPLESVLTILVQLVEAQGDGLLCSILRVEQPGLILRTGAAPSLPDAYNRAIDGLAGGPAKGSCGTVAWQKKRVVVEDIATHPYWINYRDIALAHGLLACWSTPILSPKGDILGTYAIYYRQVRGPTAQEIAWVDAATALAAIAIERENAHRDLAASEARYRQIVDTAYEGVWAVDSAGKTTFANQRMADLLGYTWEEMQQVSMYDAMDTKLRDTAADNLRRRMTGVPEQHDFLFRRKDGSEFWATVSASPLKNGEGEVIGALGMVTDISQRRQAEEQVRAQAALLDQARDAIFSLDLKGAVRFWSKGAETLYGITMEAAVGRQVDSLIDLSSAPRATSVVLSDGRWEAELAQVTRSGRELVVDARWTLVSTAGGAAQTILAIHTDITENKKLAEQFLQTQRLESLGTLAGGIAHDFNNILAAIVGNVALAEGEVDQAHPVQVYLQEVRDAGQRAAELVRQILTFSRRQQPRRVSLPLTPVLEEAARMLRAAVSPRVQIQLHTPPELPPVWADSTQILQVLMNLGTNAAGAMAESGGILTFSLERLEVDSSKLCPVGELKPGEYVRISAEDTGVGMEPGILRHIFEPFFTTKGPGRGTGLGLSVVHGIVRSHDGALEVESQPRKGTRFQIYLPVARQAHVHEVVLPDAVRGNGELILYVDDERPLTLLAAHLLERLNYRAVTYGQAEAALEDFRSRPQAFAAVITDFSMPQMNGAELARRILAIHPNIPIIMTSGYVRPEDTLAARLLGVRALLPKPSSPEDLARTLHQVLQAEDKN